MIDCGCDEILLPQGSDGIDGKNAFTITTAAFTQPAAGSNVTINVSDVQQFTNQWAIPGQIIRITDSAGRGGWYRVVSLTGTTQITITNLDYAGSSPTPTTISANAGVSPAGLQGPQGSAGGQGGQGSAGPPNVLSIPPGGVTTLAAGQPATVSITGTSPNQQLTFGIPSGMFSSKILYSDYSNGANYSTISNYTSFFGAGTPPTFQSLLAAPLSINAADLCPNDGDFATIKVVARLNVTSNPKNYFLTAWRFKINSVIIGPDPSDNSTINSSVPIVFVNMSKAYQTGVRYIELELIIQRVTSTVADIYCKGIRGGFYDNTLDLFYPPTPFFKSNIIGINFSNPSLPIDIEGAMMTDQALTTEVAVIRRESITVQTFRQS
jgi:hypothetical protein